MYFEGLHGGRNTAKHKLLQKYFESLHLPEMPVRKVLLYAKIQLGILQILMYNIIFICLIDHFLFLFISISRGYCFVKFNRELLSQQNFQIYFQILCSHIYCSICNIICLLKNFEKTNCFKNDGDFNCNSKAGSF